MGPCGLERRSGVATFEERVEGGVLAEVVLDGGESVRDEVVEPGVGKDFGDAVGATLHEVPIGTRIAGRDGPLGLFGGGA
jgi:hypothetical protein